jgi:glutamyl-tRNA synthetase
MEVKTRFAPSPTGYLHIGGVRTALFCWLYARHHGGKFLLRIEDTDRERSTQASIDAILNGMQWLDLDWDEGPYFQSERIDRYNHVAQQMLDAGQAYQCYCTPDELADLRARQKAAGEKPRYDGKCRDNAVPRDGIEPVLRFKTPKSGEVVIDDLVRGRVVFANEDLDDLVIMRANGMPTYHFSVVIDDADMEITHVMRGDDHLNNTPRHINLIQALGYKRPVYAHMPMILGEDGARLSKRHGAVNVLEYMEQGYLPDALLNYLVRLGWAHGDQEIFSREEMVTLFDIKDVNPSASRFDPEKLGWLNQQYIMHTPPEALEIEFKTQLETLGIDVAKGPPLGKVIDAFRERAVTMRALAESSRYLFADFEALDGKAAKKHLRPVVKVPLSDVKEVFAALPSWDQQEIQQAIQTVAENHDLGFGKLGQPLRVSVTGGSVSPPIDVTIELVGRERTLARIGVALDYIEDRERSARK